MFELDLNRLLALLLPAALRRPLIFGWLRAGARGVQRIYEDFCAMRCGHVFRLTHNGQVCYLRGALDYHFGGGFAIGRVKQEGEWLLAVTEAGEDIPLAAAEGPRGKGVPVLYGEQVLNSPQNDFVVLVPAGAWGRLPEIEAMVDLYKLPSKRAHYVCSGTGGSVVADASWSLKENFNHYTK